MKKTIVVFTVLCLVSWLAQAQNSEQSTVKVGLKSPSKVFKFSPQQLINNTFEIGLEKFNSSFTQSSSFTIGYMYYADNDNYYYDDIKNEMVQGAYLEYQHRFYINGYKEYRNKRDRAFNLGLYIGTSLKGEIYQISSDVTYRSQNLPQITVAEKVNFQAVNPAVVLGLQRTFWERLTIDAYVGAGTRFCNYDRPEAPAGYVNSYYYDYTGTFYINSPVGGIGSSGIRPKMGIKIGVSF